MIYTFYLFGGKTAGGNEVSKRKHWKFNVTIDIRWVPWNVLEMLFKFISVCTFLSTTIQDDCRRRTLFRVFRGHVLFEGIYFFFCIWDNRPRHFLRCRFSVLFGWTLDCHFLGRVHRIFLFFRCREWKRFYVSSRICSSVQNKEEPPAHFKKRFRLFLTLQKVTMNGFENILKWHCRKPILDVVVLEFDDSCYAMRNNIA